jgi:hypothetical protein
MKTRFAEETEIWCPSLTSVIRHNKMFEPSSYNNLVYFFRFAFLCKSEFNSSMFLLISVAYPLIAETCYDYYKLGIAPRLSECLLLMDSTQTPFRCCWNNLIPSPTVCFSLWFCLSVSYIFPSVIFFFVNKKLFDVNLKPFWRFNEN